MTFHSYAMIFLMAAGVIFLRFLPLLCFGGKRKVPAWLPSWAQLLGAAVIAMLVIYGMTDAAAFAECGAGRILPVIAASVFTGALHWIFGNPLLSIISGTTLFMLMLRFL